MKTLNLLPPFYEDTRGRLTFVSSKWKAIFFGFFAGIHRKIFRIWPSESEMIHGWFELSYANYVAIPRSILQSMPDLWQMQFVKLMDELDEHFDWRRGGCWVIFKDRRGRFMSDELSDYERGRRILTPEEVKTLVHIHNERFKAWSP